MQDSDVIVVGAGHNGLVAACYLARAGLRVTVVEAAEGIGGCTTSGALIDGAPDHIVSPGANDIITMRASTVVADLELHRHGYRELEIDPAYIWLGEDGGSIAFWRDPRRTAEEIGRYSARDAEAYLELARIARAVAAAVVPMLTQNPTRPEPRALLRAAGAVLRHPRLVAAFAPLAFASAAQAIQERFVHPSVQGALAMLAAFGPPITSEGSGTSMVLPALIARFGLGRPVGGMQTLPDSLARALAERGGEIRPGCPVEALVVRGGAVTGVRLAGGEELTARAVLTGCDPRTALTELLPAGALPERLEARARHIPTLNEGASHYKLDLALKGRVSLPRHQAQRRDDLDLRFPGTLIGSFDQLVAAFTDSAGGRVPDPLPVVGIVPSEADPSLAPEGQDTAYLWAGWTPHDPHGGWDAVREDLARSVLDFVGGWYEGIDKLEVGRRIEAWPQLTERTRVPDGNILHVDGSPLRQGPLRPARGFGGYRTPVGGLYLTGAGTHPGGSVSGIPGQIAAKVVVGDLRGGGAPPSRAAAARVQAVAEREKVAG